MKSATTTTIDTEGRFILALDVSISAREMREWPVGCIREFFRGIATAQQAVVVARESMRAAEAKP